MTATADQTKLRCMQLLWRLTTSLQSAHFPQHMREDAELALQEFKPMQDIVLDGVTDAEYELHHENIVAVLDDLEKDMDKAQRFIMSKQKERTRRLVK